MASTEQILYQRIAALEWQVAYLYRHLGVAVPTPEQMAPPGVPPEVVELVRQGSTIEAIKVYRQATGAGLAEAKQVIDSLF